jgi:hypothetical protein
LALGATLDDISNAAFLRSNPFTQLTLANAGGDDATPFAPAAGRHGVRSAQLRETPGLHRHLVRAALLQPGKVSLDVPDGVDPRLIAQALEHLLSSDDPLATLLQPSAKILRAGVAVLRLHPLMRLLLTAAQQQQRHGTSLVHAVRAMALAGALAAQVQAPADFVRRAMLAGLLHDLGEVYTNAAYLSGGRQLDLIEYRELAAHPHVGAMLLAQLSDAPEDVVRAVREHHERLDGTGYPFQLLGSSLSPLGQLLAVAELVLGAVDRRPASAARAAFALKFVPGELSGPWAGPVTRWADAQPLPPSPIPSRDSTRADMEELDAALHRMQGMAEAISDQLDGASQRVAQRAAYRLRRLRNAWNAMGLWSLPAELVDPRERFDIDLALGELRYRISTIGRNSLWPETEMRVLADARLVPLWTTLESAGRTPGAQG